MTLMAYDGGFDTGLFGNHPEDWVDVRSVRPDLLLCQPAGTVGDLCSLVYSALRDDDLAHTELGMGHVTEDWAKGALFAMWYMGVRHDGDRGWVDPSTIGMRT